MTIEMSNEVVRFYPLDQASNGGSFAQGDMSRRMTFPMAGCA
jgi:hypothetical protein